MKSLSLLKQLSIGFLLSLFASISIHSLSILLHINDAFSLGLFATALLYIGLILKNSQQTTGRVVVVLTAVIGALLMSLWNTPIEVISIAVLISIFVVRVVYNNAGLIGIAYDAGLICLGFFIAAGVLVSSGSWFLSFWCFFFIQSFIVYKPDSTTIRQGSISISNSQLSTNQKFNRARNLANQAIQQLSVRSS